MHRPSALRRPPALLALLCAGCAPVLMTPETHFANGESPHALPAGKAAVGLGVSQFRDVILIDGGWWGALANAEGVLGLGNGLDARLLVEYVSMQSLFGASPDTGSQTNLTATTGSVALRVKWNPGDNRFWAMTAGAGLGVNQTSGGGVGTQVDGNGNIGASRPQRFYSLEHAQILGFENRYVAPYANLKWTWNLPIDPRTYYWKGPRDGDSDDGNDDTQDSLYSKKLRFTFGYELLLGLKIPLAHSIKDAPYLKLEYGLQTLGDGSQDPDALSEFSDLQFVLPFSI